MKLDRNSNPAGRGKYALVNMRILNAALTSEDLSLTKEERQQISGLFDLLRARGILTTGEESPGDQFFVVKYKDRFTAPALRAYACAVGVEASILKAAGHHDAAAELHEFAGEMYREAQHATEIGYRLPD